MTGRLGGGKKEKKVAGWAISPRSPYVGGGGGRHEKDGKNTARSESEKQRSVNACCLGSERLNKVLARVAEADGARVWPPQRENDNKTTMD